MATTGFRTGTLPYKTDNVYATASTTLYSVLPVRAGDSIWRFRAYFETNNADATLKLTAYKVYHTATETELANNTCTGLGSCFLSLNYRVETGYTVILKSEITSDGANGTYVYEWIPFAEGMF